MAGYLCNATDCDHCENEHTKPNKGCSKCDCQTYTHLYGMRDVDE